MIDKILNLADLWKVKRDDFNNHNSFLLKIEDKLADRDKRRKDSKTKILQEIDRLKVIVESIDKGIKSDRKDAKLIDDEFECMRKAKSLIAKNKNKINYNIDDRGTFWVYGNYNDDDINDPFYDEHYCDTWCEVLERVNTYIDQPKY